MRAVDEADVVFPFAELFAQLLLFFAVIPQEAEIAADDQRVARFQRAQLRRRKAVGLAVGVAGDIYQNGSHPLIWVAKALKLCYTV